MRVLRSAIIATCAIGAATVTNGCFDPTLKDCQFKCGPEDTCPGDTRCMGGFCRDTTTGTCSVGSNMVDAKVADANPCPASPCGATAVPVTTGGCAALCTQPRTFTNALAMCGTDTGASGWHIAILDSSAKRTEFGQVLPAAIGWVGLQQSVGVWHWLNTSNEVQPSSGSGWASGEPNPSNPNGTFDSMNAVLRTGSTSDTKPFFCEYRP